MGSAFAAHVRDSVLAGGAAAVAAWERILLRNGNAHETGEELLRQLGLLRNAPSHSSRLRVLAASLSHPDPRMRDAAGLGLSFLHDPSALPKLRSVYSTESERWLQENLKPVIGQLEELECRGG